MGRRTLLDYEDRILGFMVRNRVPEEAERGLMLWCDKEFLDVKVRSAVFTAEARDGRLWGVAECQISGELSAGELAALKKYISGQARTAGARASSSKRSHWMAAGSCMCTCAG